VTIVYFRSMGGVKTMISWIFWVFVYGQGYHLQVFDKIDFKSEQVVQVDSGDDWRFAKLSLKSIRRD
jgi:hypothetical protein